MPVKEEYINAINNLLQQCDDISLLDLIFQLLQKRKRNLKTGKKESR